jgi:hypothetical protein
MNREVKKEMTDFPNLNMSIGEYYKILMEGKRPTRQRTTKDDIKHGGAPNHPPLTPQPTGLGRAISSSVHPGAGGGISTNRRDSGLVRSQSENH